MLLRKKIVVYKVEIHCPNLSPFHSIFMVRLSEIICGPIGDHLSSGDHSRFNLGIISGPGIICGPGSFVGLYISLYRAIFSKSSACIIHVLMTCKLLLVKTEYVY